MLDVWRFEAVREHEVRLCAQCRSCKKYWLRQDVDGQASAEKTYNPKSIRAMINGPRAASSTVPQEPRTAPVVDQRAIQQLHDLEIQGAIGWPVDGKIIVRLGCPLDGKFDTEALVSNFAEAEHWLRKVRNLPQPKRRKSEPKRPSVVDELFAAGVPVSALWLFDSLFQATFASPDDTSEPADWIVADSWAALEEMLRDAAYLRNHLEMTTADLLQRIEEADAPSHDLDVLIARAMGADVKPYSSSVDAAISLAAEELPGWRWAIDGIDTEPGRYVAVVMELEPEIEEAEYEAEAASPALALVAALLTALQARADGG